MSSVLASSDLEVLPVDHFRQNNTLRAQQFATIVRVCAETYCTFDAFRKIEKTDYLEIFIKIKRNQ